MMAEVSEESMLGHDTVCEAGQDRRGGTSVLSVSVSVSVSARTWTWW